MSEILFFIFASCEPLKLFRATVADTDTVKFEQNRLVETTRNFELFDKKRVFITIFDKELTPFWKTFL